MHIIKVILIRFSLAGKTGEKNVGIPTWWVREQCGWSIVSSERNRGRIAQSNLFPGY